MVLFDVKGEEDKNPILLSDKKIVSCSQYIGYFMRFVIKVP